MKAAICGIGAVGGFGSGVPALESVLAGSRRKPTTVSIPTREGPITVPCLTADTDRLTDYIPLRVLRRMSHYIRLAVLAAFDAMADADLLEPHRRGRLGIIVATGHGATGNNYAFQYPFVDREEICGSPIRFANSVHNAAAAYISMALEAMGPNHSITHADLSFPSAILTAVAWLRQGRLDAVLVGGADELNHAHAFAWHAHREESGQRADIIDSAPPAGEGACFLVLKSADAAASPYGVIRDVALGRDTGAPLSIPLGDCLILGKGGLAATPADYDRWVPANVRTRCYAHVYGDLPVDSAFDTAIAALSLKNNRIYPDHPGSHADETHPPAAGQTMVCLKLGVGGTYGWTVVEKGVAHRER